MKLFYLMMFGLAMSVGCSGGSNSSSSNDQNDPSSDDNSSPNSAKVECLKQNLSDLPSDYKKVIELSANAVIKCKASKSDVLAFIELGK